MNIRHPLFPSLAALLFVPGSIGAFAAASAQGLTRAQVREQLIDAQASGSQYVTDSSYPDVSPGFAPQAARARARQRQGGMGAPMQGTSDAGAPRTACVGPVSFCHLHSGS